MARKSLGYTELEWTCPYCNAKNKGASKTCHSCQAPQPEDVQFTQPAKETLITDEAKLKKAKAGADIHCAYCGARNAAGTAVCTQCGADLSEGTARQSGQKLGSHRQKEASDVPCEFCGSNNPADALSCANCGASLAKSEPAPPKQPPPPKKNSRLPMIIGIAVAVFLLMACCLFIVLSSRTTDKTGRVESVQWQRAVNVEALMPVEREDWESSIPSDAFNVENCREKEYGRQSSPPSSGNSQEICGTPYTVDEGSGFGEVVQDCEYIVYKSWCDYTVEEWSVVDTFEASGVDMNPYWPSVQLSGNQREGAKEERYTVYFRGDGDSYTYAADDEKEFQLFTTGSDWILKVNTFGSVNEVERP